MLGHYLSIEWRLDLGTNSTAVVDWGDNSNNETLANYIMANATTPFQFTSKHNYSSEGDYEVRLFVFNSFSSQTISGMAHIQVQLQGLNFTAPAIVETNTSFHLNVSLAVVSQRAPNITFRFGDGTVFSSTRFDVQYYYPKAGVFVAEATVANKVSMLTSSILLTVQDAIQEFTVDSNVYKVVLGENVRFLLSVRQGTNVLVNASFDECNLPLLTTSLSGPKHLLSSLTCAFDTVGVCNVVFYASNRVSRANASALIISEVAIRGFNVTVECQSDYPSCFQYDRIMFHLDAINGTHPKFVLDMGDGTVIASTNKSHSHFFVLNGTFDINITAYNNVSSQSVFPKIKIVELVPVTGAYLHCNRTVKLPEATVCNFGIGQGTAFQCWLNMGDKEQSGEVFYTYVNFTSSFTYNYTSYGTYSVKFICNNRISSSSDDFTTMKVPRNLKISVSHNGPIIVNNVLTLTLRASETGYASCFVLDLGNNDGVVFGSINCRLDRHDGFKRIPSFTYPLVRYNYSYTVAGAYNITWNGHNVFSNSSAYTLVQITEWPCSTPEVTLRNIANDPLSPTRISRSKEFNVRSGYQVDCNKASGAILEWEFYKNQTNEGFVLQTTKVTKTSELIIQSNELVYGTYCIKLRLSLINTYGISATAEGYLRIVSSDLVVDIQEGSANKRSLSHPVLISAFGSKDPDNFDQSGLKFNWFCYNVTDRVVNITEEPLAALLDTFLQGEPLGDGCFGQNGSLVVNGSQVALPHQGLIKNGIYVLNLVLTSGNRKASKATVVQMTDEEISHFHIRLVTHVFV